MSTSRRAVFHSMQSASRSPVLPCFRRAAAGPRRSRPPSWSAATAGAAAARAGLNRAASPARRSDSSPAAHHPRRHQLRPRRRHRHRQEGQAGRSTSSRTIRGPRGRQAAEGRNLPAGQDRRDSQIDGDAPPRRFADDDEEREAARPDVRLFVILLDDYHVRAATTWRCAKPLIDFIQNQLAPGRHGRADVSADADHGSELHAAITRPSIGAIENFEGRKFDYRPRNEFEERYAYYPAADRRADPQRGHDGRAQGRRA